MAQSYAEYLMENGATADEVKVLDTPAAQRAYAKMAAQVEAAAVEQRKAKELIDRNREWATEVETQNQSYLRERDTALATAAAESARLKKLQELGLLQVAENLEPGSTTPRAGETPAFDPKLLEKYVDRDTLMAVAEREGDAIATAQDISFEHAQLFGADPTKRLNFRELRKEAVQRKMPVESLWMERYGVQAARDAAAAKAQKAHEEKIAAEAITKYKSEHPETNPLLARPVISSTPFTGKTLSGGDPKAQPWNRPDADKENARLAKGLQGLEKAGLVH
jgi:hypothetical protein